MTRMFKGNYFSGQSAIACDGRFVRPEARRADAPAMCVQFGSRLRRLYEVPCAEGQPDQFQALLKQIETKLDCKG